MDSPFLGIEVYAIPPDPELVQEALTTQDWNFSQITSGNEEPYIRCSSDKVLILNSPIYQKLLKIFDACLFEYAAKYKVTVHSGEAYQVLKYEIGEFYDWHTDVGQGNSRIISGIFYLNENYSGGELEFKHLGVVYKPKAFDLLLFPSNFIYRHRSTPVTQGTKYAVVSWMS